MADPDPLRIRYRETLILVIQAIVQGRQEPSAKNIQQLAYELVPANDREAFNKIAADALQRLHEGSVARYRLKLSEFQSWKPIRDRYYPANAEQ